MMGFYSNLLTKNIALGGSLDSAVSAYTVGSSRNTSLLQTDVTDEALSSTLAADAKAAVPEENVATGQRNLEPSLQPEQSHKAASFTSDAQSSPIEGFKTEEVSTKPSPVR